MKDMSDDISADRKIPFVVFRCFLSQAEQVRLVQEALVCHQRHRVGQEAADYWQAVNLASSSLKLELGIPCGGDLSHSLPAAVSIARRAFAKAAHEFPHVNPLEGLAQDAPLTGLSLLYGPHASMSPHYDSPTQPLQREEWLVMMTAGHPILFRCNDQVLRLESGDAMVLDSMAVFHGVERVIEDGSTAYRAVGLPFPSRLGVLLWQGRSASEEEQSSYANDTDVADGVGRLFGDDEDSA